MRRFVFLDSGILGLVTHPKWEGDTAKCYRWMREVGLAGDTIVIPEISDYEVRRELLRMKREGSIRRLDALIQGSHYLPINTLAMRLAAEIWAKARLAGQPTAPDTALDGDVILAAQALQAKIDFELDIIVATTNVDPIGRFVPAYRWQDILPRDAEQ